MRIDLARVLNDTLRHLQAHPTGHVAFGLVATVVLQVSGIVLGVGSSAAASLGSLSTMVFGPAGLLGIVVGGALFVIGFAALMWFTSIAFMAYQKATLDEVDGRADVALRTLRGALVGSMGLVIALSLAQCGLGLLGLMLCYVGTFITSVPFRFAWLLAVERQLGAVDALAAAWRTFWASPADHLVSFGLMMVVMMTLGSIPVVGLLVAWPFYAVAEAYTFRQLFPLTPGGADAPRP